MTYIFKCLRCDKRKEITKSMTDPFPKVFCECGKIMNRDYAEEMSKSKIIIPEHMKGTFQTSSKSSFNYDKSPSGKKHIW